MKAFETIVVSNSVKTLNSEIYKHGFEKATVASLFVAGGDIRYRVDGGEPTALVGIPAFDGDGINLEGHNEIKFFKAIRSGAVDATISCDYSTPNRRV
jgi:hypothetical protein